MINPNRTYFLQLKEKAKSVTGSLHILKARRQALVLEFLKSSRPFLETRREISLLYRQALDELSLSLGHQGEREIDSIAAVNRRDLEVALVGKNILGVEYLEIEAGRGIVRGPGERHYDYAATTPHLEEAAHAFEKLAEAMLRLAAFENKLKKLGEAIMRVTRKTRVLEERILPEMHREMKAIAMYIGEREREEFFRLKRFKGQGHAGKV